MDVMLTLKDVANKLKVSVWTVRRWTTKEGKLKYYRVSKGIRVKEKDLEDYLKTCEACSDE